MSVEGGIPYRQMLANRVSARQSAKRKRELAFSSPAKNAREAAGATFDRSRQQYTFTRREDNPARGNLLLSTIEPYAKTVAGIEAARRNVMAGLSLGVRGLYAPTETRRPGDTADNTILESILQRIPVSERTKEESRASFTSDPGLSDPLFVGLDVIDPSPGGAAASQGLLAPLMGAIRGLVRQSPETRVLERSGPVESEEIINEIDDVLPPSASSPSIEEVYALVDSPQVYPGTAKKKRAGEIPYIMDDSSTTTGLLFGPKVQDTGRLGSSIREQHLGTTVTIGKKLDSERVFKDMALVARNAIRERFKGSRLPALDPNSKAGKAREKKLRKWAENTLNNFENDFGEGSARVMSIEGSASRSGEYNPASVIPQTIQHDHTVVSPTDLAAYRDETEELFNAGEIGKREYNKRKKVLADMQIVLEDPRNLVPIHRNTNIILGGLDREEILNNPELALKLGISEESLGDIWRIMSDQNSGYRKSVNEAYAWARSGGRKKSVDAWKEWQKLKQDDIIARRDERRDKFIGF